MFSFRATVLAVATVLVANTRADYYIDPNSVSLTTRESWCTSETQQCPYICRDMGASGASTNTCNATSLTYGCLCSDGKTPNASEYSLTLPYFVCVEYVSQCVAACDSNSTCQGACQQDHPCGATDPVTNKVNSTATASSTSTSSTSGGDTVYTGLDGKSAAGPPAFELARLYATMATLGLFGMGFMYLL
ncbi:hypothetical protein N0V93_003243 [Gnomoniopsis smithogilvyi]|uniref:DUF7707 domain-containing protein n=1 Tax=Gnomoniopsis smithogilvyi TaxID=1191159 RepID=A0A9W8YY34_9PEZI|nr:hypothetical protein N0V93_003243 [Gnomoniopsis smithogilvyi]